MGGRAAQMGTSNTPLEVVCSHSTVLSHLQADSTGQLNTILTYLEITEPAVPSSLSDIPMTVLRRAIQILAKTSRAQVITIADGEGVRFLPGNTGR